MLLQKTYFIKLYNDSKPGITIALALRIITYFITILKFLELFFFSRLVDELCMMLSTMGTILTSC